MPRLTQRRAAIAGLTLVVALGAGALAFAAIPDSSGAINACFGPTGKLRAVDASTDCTGAETHVALGGPTYGYEFSDPDFLEIGETTTVVASLALPAGRYLVHGKLDLLGGSPTEESFVVCNLRIGGTAGFSDAAWNTLEPGVAGRLPSESMALQTSLVLASAGSVEMTCVRPEADAGAIARYRKLDAVRVDGLTTSG